MLHTHLLPLGEAGQAGGALRLPVRSSGCLALGRLPGVCGRQAVAHGAAVLLSPLPAQARFELRRQRLGALGGGGGSGGCRGRRSVRPFGAGRHQHAGLLLLGWQKEGERLGRQVNCRC